MKKPLLISLVTLAVVASAGAVAGTVIAFERPTKYVFTDKIQAVSHNNETINILNGNIQKLWEIDNLYNDAESKLPEIANLYTYNDELASFSKSGIYDVNENLWKVFDKYDSYKPVNNVISWKSELENVKQYTVNISRDKYFKTLDHSLTAQANENSVKINDLLTGVTYYWQVKAELNDNSSVFSKIYTFDVEDTTRTINAYGICNTRDWGGYINKDGIRTKQGLVYRGARLDNHSEEGKETLKHLGVKTDLDLRAAGEGRANPLNLENAFNYSCPYYAGISTGLDVESYQPAFGNAIKTFANKDNYPIYFHCSVGRDRTGTLSAMLNILCEVDKEIAIKEYLISLFSVTGAFAKNDIGMYNQFRSIYKYLSNFDGQTPKEQAIEYLTKRCGVTLSEINSIVNILTGKEEMDDYLSIDNPDSFKGYSLVEMIRPGSREFSMVLNGNKLENPIPELDGKWYCENKVWDFENDEVKEDTTLVFKETKKFKVTINYVGIEKALEVIEIRNGDELDFSQFKIDGKTMTIFDDSLKEITSLTVTRDMTINIIYN